MPIRPQSRWRSLLLVCCVVFIVGIMPAYAVEPATVNATAAQEVYDRVAPAVVALAVLRDVGGDDTTLPQEHPELNDQGWVTGTGFVIDTAGHIVTNAHVVEQAQRIEVNFFNGIKARGELIGADPAADIAVIKVELDSAQLTPIAWGDSAALDVGEDVFALGSPYGQDWTLTRGIISALNRSIPSLTIFSTGGVIQTDAAINPGNSGGPLLNVRGEVIGVNAQIRTESGSNSGIGFAIPANLAKRVALELIETGSVNYSYMGITGGNVDLTLVEALNLPNDTQGVVVSEVLPNSPADNAGIQTADDFVDTEGGAVPMRVDIITAINGTPLHSIDDLIGYLATYTRPGDVVTLTVIRDGKETLQIEATLLRRPQR